MPKRDIHVIPREDGWAVLREGASRHSSHHDRKSDPMNAACGTRQVKRAPVSEVCQMAVKTPMKIVM